MRIIFKDKQNSSGTIKAGEILLYISSRLPQSEQQRHIDLLSEKLASRLEATKQLAAAPGAVLSLPLGLTPSTVTDDQALAAWAAAINAQYYGYQMGQVRFRKQESRWGSCSGRTRNIQISQRLRGGPHELLEYVLIHEIAHLGEFNHSQRFWALVAKASPDWRAKRALLRRYEAYLTSQPR
jgi:predicted metal-dependent hydrolase